ncbi:glycosyltransferase [Sphingobacterium arenae]|uniref:Glycosyltransferase family 4 protein n=1 Tax=Sphingobacterium arenae TaxID=1280598 RepID=A0ABR7XZ07_9SPHI|nr:glycosyltransferase [Sphingobacterium arenae]MBD1424271.1 glycosyltransferase family 4 protein [Sphingobacterium arenae]
MKTILFIGLVWPEPQSSAAGIRILQLVRMFRRVGYEVVFASAAVKSPYSHPLYQEGIHEEDIQLNNSGFDAFIASLKPDIVVFDRFISEEQYGWRVREHCPSALTILDTEDLHFLRRARQDAVKRGTAIDYYNDTATREIAAILRCDLSLIISKNELELLLETFHLPAELLYYLPFLESNIEESTRDSWLPFEERKDFVFIGNFLHEPNWHTVRILKAEIWPKIRNCLPTAELHIYGAYASEKVYQLHQPKENFLIKGRAEDARKTLEAYKVLVAPILFGAGVKGKFIDAMQAGTPSVTTVIGAESMSVEGIWGGYMEDDLDCFSQKAVGLYRDRRIWYEAQEKGIYILHKTSSKEQFEEPFLTHINALNSGLSLHRQRNFMGQILRNQQHSANKYMSLWIEEKNKYLR